MWPRDARPQQLLLRPAPHAILASALLHLCRSAARDTCAAAMADFLRNGARRAAARRSAAREVRVGAATSGSHPSKGEALSTRVPSPPSSDVPSMPAATSAALAHQYSTAVRCAMSGLAAFRARDDVEAFAHLSRGISMLLPVWSAEPLTAMGLVSDTSKFELPMCFPRPLLVTLLYHRAAAALRIGYRARALADSAALLHSLLARDGDYLKQQLAACLHARALLAVGAWAAAALVASSGARMVALTHPMAAARAPGRGAACARSRLASSIALALIRTAAEEQAVHLPERIAAIAEAPGSIERPSRDRLAYVHGALQVVGDAGGVSGDGHCRGRGWFATDAITQPGTILLVDFAAVCAEPQLADSVEDTLPLLKAAGECSALPKHPGTGLQSHSFFAHPRTCREPLSRSASYDESSAKGGDAHAHRSFAHLSLTCIGHSHTRLSRASVIRTPVSHSRWPFAHLSLIRVGPSHTRLSFALALRTPVSHSRWPFAHLSLIRVGPSHGPSHPCPSFASATRVCIVTGSGRAHIGPPEPVGRATASSGAGGLASS